MNPFKIALGFVPFILFSLLDSWLSVGWAATIGLVAAIGVAVATARGGLKILPVVQAVILGIIAVVGFTSGSAADSFLNTYGRGLASLTLGAFIVVTAAWIPFTAQFARALVPRDQWTSPVFVRLNRELSIAWGGVVLVLGGCHLLGAYLSGHDTRPIVRLAVQWVVPILAFLWVIKYTRRTASQNAGPASTSSAPTANA